MHPKTRIVTEKILRQVMRARDRDQPVTPQTLTGILHLVQRELDDAYDLMDKLQAQLDATSLNPVFRPNRLPTGPTTPNEPL